MEADKAQAGSLPVVDFSRKWYVMAAVAAGIFLATIDGSIVNVALPTLVAELGTDFAAVQWVVLSYLLTITALLAIVGRLGDMFGKKPIYTSGFIVFTLGSLLCALAPTVGWLIAARILQGVGAAFILALGLAIVTEAFPPSERGRALGVGGSIVSIGIVTGPTLGGLILQNLSWHWIFMVNVPIGIVGTWLAARNVPPSRPLGRQQFDFGGAISLSLSLLALLLGLTAGQRAGFTSPAALGLVGIAAVGLALFVRLEWRHPQPVIDPRLFRNRLFSVNLVTGFLIFVGLGSGVLLPFYLQNVLGYSVQQVGFLLAVLPVALGIVAPVSGSLSDRFGTRPISVLGLAITTFGFLLLSTLTAETTALGFMARYLPIGIGVGLFQSPNNSAIMGSVPRERLGVASGLLAIARTLGQTVGFAVLGALWAAFVFRAAGGPLAAGATAAPPEAQVAALRATMLAVAGLAAAAFLIAVWAWRGEHTGVSHLPEGPAGLS
jgi:EmrB/QacA subfamily drug resistance transporter